MEIETIKDIEELVENKIMETTNLEYKHPDKLKQNNGIAKSVASMANSSGGTIIFGVGEEKGVPKEIVFMNDPKLMDKLHQIVSSNIQRPLEVNIKKISKDKKNFLIIVDVPKSLEAPHQVSEGDKRRYYRRSGAITREMEHYEIEDLMVKRKSPSIQLEIIGNYNRKNFQLQLKNYGNGVGEKVMITMFLPDGIQMHCENSFKLVSEGIDNFGKKYRKYQFFEKEIPLYPKSPPMTIAELESKKEISNLKISYNIVCQDMPFKVYSTGFNGFKNYQKEEDGDGMPYPSIVFM